MKKGIIVAGIAFAAVLLWLGIASAHGTGGMLGNGSGNQMGMNQMNMGAHHEEMEKLMEEGNYAELVKLREANGFNMMPWVENEEDFKLAQQMHEKMDKFHENMPMKGGMMGMGAGMGSCPMMG